MVREAGLVVINQGPLQIAPLTPMLLVLNALVSILNHLVKTTKALSK